MLRKRLTAVAIVLALLVALSPAPSQAIPWSWTPRSGPAAARLVMRIERWWNLLLDRAERPAAGEKAGCAIDPNGATVCGTGNGGGTTPSGPPSAEPTGSG